jgi:hypothetical protein
MKYMLLIYLDPETAPDPASAEGQEDHGAWMRISQELAESGQMLSGDALQGTDTATTVRVRGGEQVLTDGPFAETKEILGGFYIVDVPDVDSAVAWAARLPNAPRGSVEVRPVMEFAQT